MMSGLSEELMEKSDHNEKGIAKQAWLLTLTNEAKALQTTTIPSLVQDALQVWSKLLQCMRKRCQRRCHGCKLQQAMLQLRVTNGRRRKGLNHVAHVQEEALSHFRFLFYKTTAQRKCKNKATNNLRKHSLSSK